MIQRVELPLRHQRLGRAARGLGCVLLGSILLWLARVWGDVLSWWAGSLAGLLAIVAVTPMAAAHAFTAVELRWCARVSRKRGPGSGVWRVGLTRASVTEEAALLWWWAMGARALTLGIAQRGWRPRMIVLALPWVAEEPLRRMRRALCSGPPPLDCRAPGGLAVAVRHDVFGDGSNAAGTDAAPGSRGVAGEDSPRVAHR